jgi:hypothetical protein
MSVISKASLVLIPSGYGEDILYSEVPNTTAGDFTFTRASSGTRVNADGYIEDVPWNELTYSEDFSNSSWVKSNVTIGTSIHTSPLGNSQKVIGSNDTLLKLLFKNNIITPTKTISALVKAEGYNYAIIFTGGGARVVFDLLNGVVGHSIGTFQDASINSQGDGWYIISMSNPNHTSYASVTGAASDSVYDRTGNGIDGISLAYIQVNKGTSPKTYIKTTDRLDVPRLDYSGGASCPTLLLEGQSTNEITYSEIFTESGYYLWNYSTNALEVAESNSIISPDGTQNADKIAKTALRVYATAFRNVTLISAQNYSWSMFMKKGTHDIGFLSLQNGDTEYKAYYDLTNGTSGMLSGSATHKIEDYGNGWFRCSLQDISSTTDLSVRFNFGMAYSTSNEYWSSSSEGEGLYAYFWGAQLEQGNLTSYIPTNGTSVTRVGDVCDDAGDASIFNSSEGVLFAEIATFIKNPPLSVLGLSDGSGTNRISFQTNGVDNQILFRVDASGTQANFTYTFSDITDFNKIALKYKQDDFSFWVNGVKVGTDTVGNVPINIDTLDFYYGNGPFKFYGKCKQLITFNEALTDSELEELTTI